MNHKFGGPVVIAPPKPKKPVTTAAPMAPAKPGSAAKRPAPVSASRSLEKVLSNDQLKRRATRRPNDILARMRSATPATIPGLKREASEPLALNTIPHGDKVMKERSRNVISRSVSSASVESMKAEKKAKTEAELKEAISALKKPNRQLVGMTIAEEAEKRAGSSSSPRPRSESTLNHVAVLRILTSDCRIEETRITLQRCEQATGPSQGDPSQLPIQGCNAGSGPAKVRKLKIAATKDGSGDDPIQLYCSIHSAKTGPPGRSRSISYR